MPYSIKAKTQLNKNSCAVTRKGEILCNLKRRECVQYTYERFQLKCSGKIKAILTPKAYVEKAVIQSK